MNTIGRMFVLLIAVSLLAVGVGLISDKRLYAGTSSAATPGPVPATVTNIPLPVSGNVGVSGSVSVVNPASAPVRVQITGASLVSHMGQPASGLVTLDYLGGCRCFKRVGPDGTIASDPFAIPAGEVFVLMDLDWSETAIGDKAGQTASLILVINNTVLLDSRGTFSADSQAGKTEHMSGGRVLSAVPTLATNDVTDNVILSGYLLPNN